MTVSSYIPTAGAAASRVADSLYFPVGAKPQAMTVYARLVEHGTVLNNGKRLWQFGSAAPLFMCYVNGGYYNVYINNDKGQTRASAMTTAPTAGDIVELAAQLYVTGVMQLIQSIDGATASISSASNSITLPDDWSSIDLWFNGATSVGLVKLLNVCVERGVHNIDYMRRKAGVK